MFKNDLSIRILIELRDPCIIGHQERVASLASAIAGLMGFSHERIAGVHLAATMHDIGKIYVPAETLNKPGGLREVELEMVRSHPRIGYELLKKAHFPWPIPDIVLQHHERMDGSGYSQGLSGNEIALEARILAVADVVDAMQCLRSHRPAHSLKRILDELCQNRGVLYDADVVDACVTIVTEKHLSGGQDDPVKA